MLAFRTLCFISFLLSCGALEANQHNKRTCKAVLTTSVIIPCSSVHANELFQLVSHLTQQTTLPDEVIISLSECHKVKEGILQTLTQEQWPFTLTVLTAEKVQYAGENRNIACSCATGDILILQDADDIPHPQRIEIIKYFFEQYHIDHLMHYYTLIPNQNASIDTLPIDKDTVLFEWGKDFKKIWTEGKFTNGNVAITQEVFKTHQWSITKKRAQDTQYNNDIYSIFNNCLLLRVPLLYYRQFLSTTKVAKNP